MEKSQEQALPFGSNYRRTSVAEHKRSLYKTQSKKRKKKHNKCPLT